MLRPVITEKNGAGSLKYSLKDAAMKTLLLSLLLSSATLTFGRVDTLNSTSTIQNATVFLSGAEISRSVDLRVAAGQHLVVLDKLPLEINPKSIQVGTIPGAKIISVKHELHYPQVDRNNKQQKALETHIEAHEQRLHEIKNEMEVFRIEENLLLDNKQFGSKDEPLTVVQLREAADFYRDRLNEIRGSMLELQRERDDTERAIHNLNKQINRAQPVQPSAQSRILIHLSSARDVSGSLRVSYYVPSAAWTPVYDFRVESTQKPLNIVYNAHVYQSTGEDWKNVKITLSTGNPSLSGTKPQLHTWFLDRRSTPVPAKTQVGHGSLQGRVLDSETDEPLPFVNVVLKKDNRDINGQATDIDGRYNVKPIDPGYYDIEVNSIGYEKQRIKNLMINANRTTFQDISLNPSPIQLSEFEVVQYQVPLIDKDGGPSGGTVTRSDISRSPGRTGHYTGGVPRAAIQESAHYFIDGVKVRGTTRAPLNIAVEDMDNKIGNLEYAIDLPYTIPSDGQDYLIKIKEEITDVRYVYHAIPKLDTDVFLTAEITGWASLNLLNGQSSIYYNGTFTGESFLDTQHMGDTLSISLAREPNILVERISDKDFNDRRIIGSNVRETIAWKIIVKNNLGHAINLVVEDQFPLAERRSIEVNLLENSGAKVDALRGKLIWDAQLPSGDQLTLNHGYSIKYPSGTRLYSDN